MYIYIYKSLSLSQYLHIIYKCTCARVRDICKVPGASPTEAFGGKSVFMKKTSPLGLSMKPKPFEGLKDLMLPLIV